VKKYYSSPILVNVMMQALHSIETSVLRKSTRRYIPEDGIIDTKAVKERCDFFVMNSSEEYIHYTWMYIR
jgi:hypothetical protein